MATKLENLDVFETLDLGVKVGLVCMIISQTFVRGWTSFIWQLWFWLLRATQWVIKELI